MGVSKTFDHIQIKIKISNPSQESPASSNAQNQDIKDMDMFAPSKSRQRAKTQNMATIGNIYYPPKPPTRTYRMWMIFAPPKLR